MWGVLKPLQDTAETISFMHLFASAGLCWSLYVNKGTSPGIRKPECGSYEAPLRSSKSAG